MEEKKKPNHLIICRGYALASVVPLELQMGIILHCECAGITQFDLESRFSI